MSSLTEAIMEAFMGRSKNKKNYQNKGQAPSGFQPQEYREYEYLDKQNNKKKFRLKVSDPIKVNNIGNSIFGGRYYTLSEDPEYMKIQD